MSKRKHKREGAQLYARVTQSAASAAVDNGSGHQDVSISEEMLASSKELSCLTLLSQPRELPKMKKFRFQLLHQWIATHLKPCRVADVGGGKGLLAYLLQGSGWSATVIDPVQQTLPTKYKDLNTNKQVRIAATEQVPRLNKEFEFAMAQHFDLLVAMHAHGCNLQLIDAAAHFGRDLILLPCCVIHEPQLPPAGMHWIQWVVEYAVERGFTVEPFRLNFKGQNIGIYAQA